VDDRRFDGLTRAMARNAPRRTLLRALAGGAGGALLAVARRGSPASAHHGSLGPGDACYDSGQCVGADAPLVCADNGFADDGPLNCCTYVGSNCGSDEACCGAATCAGGICASAPAPGGCTGEGCACAPNAPNPCDQGLICCGEPDGSGVCRTLYQCTGTGAPGDACPQYCLPGPTQCPSCVSGYCTAAGSCG
jgi:hypothetical protein